MSVEAVRKDSLYEYLSPLEKPLTQHFVDMFDGDVLDPDRWTTYNIFGANTFAMADGIDQGFRITTQGGINNRGGIQFGGNIRQYDPFNSSSIQYATRISGADALMAGGLGVLNPDAGSSTSERTCWLASTLSGTYDLNTSNGTLTSVSNTPISIDLLQHRHQVYATNTTHYYTIDGVLGVSTNTFLPNSGMSPFFLGWTNGASVSVTSIQYMEAFNY